MRAALFLRSALVILILGMSSCPLSLACGCIAPENLTMYELVKQSVDRADLVFSGIPTVLHGDGKSKDTQDLVIFEVEQVLKGKQGKQIGVHSGIGCG